MSFRHSHREHKQATSFHEQNVYARMLKYTGQTKSATMTYGQKLIRNQIWNRLKEGNGVGWDMTTALPNKLCGEGDLGSSDCLFIPEINTSAVLYFKCSIVVSENRSAPMLLRCLQLSLLIREQCLPPRIFDSLTLDTAL